MTDSDGAMYGDDVYTDGVEDASDFDPAENLTGDDLEEPLDTSYSPPDYEPKATRYGTTAFEQEQGESLDQRVAEEEPDLDPDAATDESADPRAGRLIAPDEGAHADDESEEFAFDVGRAGSAASAEEAAMHIVDEDAVDVAVLEEDTDS
jgi:hypothetical protein